MKKFLDLWEEAFGHGVFEETEGEEKISEKNRGSWHSANEVIASCITAPVSQSHKDLGAMLEELVSERMTTKALSKYLLELTGEAEGGKRLVKAYDKHHRRCCFALKAY